MALTRGSGAPSRGRAMPTSPDGRIAYPIHRPNIAAPAGVRKLQGLVRKRRGNAPDVEAEMAALQEQLAGAQPSRGRGSLAGLAEQFGNAVTAPARRGADGVAHVLRTLNPVNVGRQVRTLNPVNVGRQAARSADDGLRELLELVGRAGL